MQCRNLFDVMVLMSVELRRHSGEVETALGSLREDQYGDGPRAVELINRAISEAWGSAPLLAGNKEIDGQVRDVLARVVDEFEPTYVLLPLLLALEKRCLDIYTRRPCPLNRQFHELARVYRNPPQQLRSLMPGTPEPPGRPAKWMNGQLHDFCVVFSEPNDLKLRFVEEPYNSVSRPAGPGLVVALADHTSSDDTLSIEVLGSSKGLKRTHVSLVPGPDAGERLRKLISEMDARGVNVAVFPELTMTADLLPIAADTLKDLHWNSQGKNALRLLIAGSLHTRKGKREVVNTSHVLGADGRELWSQEKLTAYQWPDGAPTHQEALDVSTRTLWVCDLWFGRTVVTICLDYLAVAVAEVTSDLRVTSFLVPAMTGTTELFRSEAFARVRTMQAGSFLSNAFAQTQVPDPGQVPSCGVTPDRRSGRLRRWPAEPPFSGGR